MSKQKVCQRCGKCCHMKLFKKNGEFEIKSCKHLVKLSIKKTICRIYKKRLNQHLVTDELGVKYKCILRANSKFDYEKCPLNTNKPIFKPELKIKGEIKK